MSGRVIASIIGSDFGTDGECAWGEPCERATAASGLSQGTIDAAKPGAQLGRAASISSHARRGGGLFGALAGKCRRGKFGGGFAAPRGFGPTAWQAGKAVGGLPDAGPARLAKSGTRHPPSQEQTRSPGGMEKKLPEDLAGLLNPDAVRGRRVRLMFQDEARFGRMVRIRRCWSPAPQRPVVDNGYEREFQYVYGAVSPLEGELDWMICPAMNTENRSAFLAQVSAAHPEDFIVTIVDGASSHVAKALAVPANIRLHRLPAYSPELNPQEHLWDEIREKEFPNRVFSDMAGVVRTLEAGWPRLASDHARVQSICAWPWMLSLILNAT